MFVQSIFHPYFHIMGEYFLDDPEANKTRFGTKKRNEWAVSCIIGTIFPLSVWFPGVFSATSCQRALGDWWINLLAQYNTIFWYILLILLESLTPWILESSHGLSSYFFSFALPIPFRRLISLPQTKMIRFYDIDRFVQVQTQQLFTPKFQFRLQNYD